MGVTSYFEQSKARKQGGQKWVRILCPGYGCAKGPGGGVEGYPFQGHTARGVGAPKYLLVPVGRLFYCSEQPKLGLGRPEGAQNALKWPKITQNGSGQPLVASKRLPPPCYTSGGHRGTKDSLLGPM